MSEDRSDQRTKPPKSPAARGDVRARILLEAARVFSESGVATASMREIAERVGVTKPAVYYHFPSKQHLHYEIHVQALDEALADLTSIREMDRPASWKLEAVISLILRSIAERRHVYTILLRDANRLSPEHWATIRAKGHQYHALLEEIILDGQKDAEFAPVDPGSVGLALLGMCNWAYTWLKPEGRLSVPELSAQFADVLLNGITPKTAATPATEDRAGRSTVTADPKATEAAAAAVTPEPV